MIYLVGVARHVRVCGWGVGVGGLGGYLCVGGGWVGGGWQGEVCVCVGGSKFSPHSVTGVVFGSCLQSAKNSRI